MVFILGHTDLIGKNITHIDIDPIVQGHIQNTL